MYRYILALLVSSLLLVGSGRITGQGAAIQQAAGSIHLDGSQWNGPRI